MGDSGTNEGRKSRVGALLSWCVDPKRGAHWMAMGGLAAVFVGGWITIWNRSKEDVYEDPQYKLSVEFVEINETPPWIRANIARDVYCKLDLAERPFVLDPVLPKKAGEAFTSHPWVSEVKRVTVVAGPRLRAELTYRQPVCMVDLALQRQSVLFPIDEHGVSLPEEDFTAAEKTQYLRLVGIERPQGPPPAGEAWVDQRVLDAARIAKLFEEAAKTLELDRIVPYQRNPREYEYILCTRQGTCIEWGSAPGSEDVSELPAEEKVVKLLTYAEQHGSLEGPAGDPQIINIRYDLKASPRTVGSRSYLEELLR